MFLLLQPRDSRRLHIIIALGLLLFWSVRSLVLSFVRSINRSFVHSWLTLLRRRRRRRTDSLCLRVLVAIFRRFLCKKRSLACVSVSQSVDHSHWTSSSSSSRSKIRLNFALAFIHITAAIHWLVLRSTSGLLEGGSQRAGQLVTGHTCPRQLTRLASQVCASLCLTSLCVLFEPAPPPSSDCASLCRANG